jgi:hypothetical protein
MIIPFILLLNWRRGLAVRLALFTSALLVLDASAHADERYRDYRRTIFVAQQYSTLLTAIDIDDDALVGRLEIGIEPRELQVSQRGGKLVAIDQRSPNVAVVDLATRDRRQLALPLAPTHVRISLDGERLAAFDDATGRVVLIDIAVGRELGRIEAPKNIRDAIFSGDGKSLLIAASDLNGVAVYDTATAELSTTIDGPKVTALLRAPNGREAFALSADAQRTIVHVDLRSSRVIASQPLPQAAALFSTRTGIQLLAVDPSAGTLSILPAEPLAAGISLPTRVGASVAYAAWFDTVAFVPDAESRKLLIFDLERRKANGSITLDGTPSTGVVTPDGDKLYLPILETGSIAVISSHLRQPVASIALGFGATQIIIAGGYGLCH